MGTNRDMAALGLQAVSVTRGAGYGTEPLDDLSDWQSPSEPLICDRCLYVADFLITITRDYGGGECFNQLWCWPCVSGTGDDE